MDTERIPKATVFVSYSWVQKDEVDQLEAKLRTFGIPVRRDVRDLKVLESIREFMKSIRKSEYVIILLSDSYLRSENCMFEVIELIKDESFRDRVIPLFEKTADIFSPEGRLNYIRYWTERCDSVKSGSFGLPLETLETVTNDLKILSQISMTIGEFIDIVRDIRSFKFEDLTNKNLELILEILGFRREKIFSEGIEISQIQDPALQDIRSEYYLVRNPHYELALLLRAQCSQKLGLAQKSALYFKKLVESFPKNESYWIDYGNLLKNNLRMPKEALQKYEKALEINPKSVSALVNKASLLKSQSEKFSLARDLYEEALTLDPSNTYVLCNFANLLKDHFKEYDQAKDLYEKALKINPNDSKSLMNYGTLLFDRDEDLIKAEQLFRKSIKLAPKDWGSLNNFGNFLMEKLNKPEEAFYFFIKSIIYSEGNHLPHMNLGRLFHRHPVQQNLAEKEYLTAIGLNPEFFNTYVHLCELYVNVFRSPEKARKLLEDALTQYPESEVLKDNYAKIISQFN